jgi:voltage-gated potassium channel Kch
VVQSDRTAALFGRLLALLVALFVLLPFVEPRGFAVGAGRIAVEVAIVAAVWRLRSSLHVPVLVTAITALNELTGWLEKISPEPFLVVTSRVITLVFLGVTGVFLSRYFWKHRVVDAGSLAGALSVYLLLGYFWGTAFGLLEYLEPDSFQGACLPRPDGASSCDALRADFPRLGYLGFVTLTTLGYGDVVPVGTWARAMAGLEALLGQLFLVVLVARLVALHASASEHRSER